MVPGPYNLVATPPPLGTHKEVQYYQPNEFMRSSLILMVYHPKKKKKNHMVFIDKEINPIILVEANDQTCPSQ